MFRFLIVGVTAVCTIQGMPADAQQHRVAAELAARTPAFDRGVRTAPVQLVADRYRRRSSSRRQSRGPSLFGFSIGIGNYYSDRRSGYYEFDPNAFSGYAYDPYTFGHFEAPNLLKDPYFRERYRYDSHFKSPLIPRKTANHSAPATRYRSYGGPTTRLQFARPPAGPAGNNSHSERLRSACQQLSQSLAAREDGQAWVEFLAVDRISGWVDEGNISELELVLTHYDGVAGNPEYKSISSAGGFASTRSLLRRHVD